MLAALAVLLASAHGPRADVVVLCSGRAYAGHIEEATSQTIRLFDGNLRRVFFPGDVQEVINERPDTSWVIVGDRMVVQRDWKSAAEAYRKALALTDQPQVVLRRLDCLRDFRYELPGGKEAEALLTSGDYEAAARALFRVVLKAETSAQRHYWIGRLARAYVGLASQQSLDVKAEVDPYLIYALAIAPTCSAAHALVGERLAACGHPSTAQREFLLALDLDPLDGKARAGLEKLGQPWSYDAKQTDRSGLREWAERLSPLALTGDAAPLTTPALARIIEQRVRRLGEQPARLLVAAYLLDPTVALAYEGALPYPAYKDHVRQILRETDNPAIEKTPYDRTFIGKAIAVRLDPRFVRAIADVRSQNKPDFVAPDGSRGLVLLNRQRWEIARRAAGVDWEFEPGSLEPEKNVELACRYFVWLRDEVLRPYVGTRLDRLERIHDNL